MHIGLTSAICMVAPSYRRHLGDLGSCMEGVERLEYLTGEGDGAGAKNVTSPSVSLYRFRQRRYSLVQENRRIIVVEAAMQDRIHRRDKAK